LEVVHELKKKTSNSWTVAVNDVWMAYAETDVT